MNFTHQNNLRLFARNEGKIKSYESCVDVRAWSHDVRAKDRHLREWMKADMPIGIFPAKTLVGFLKSMTCKSRSRATPRCHPNCKTNVLLESICNSCQAVRECLQQNDRFESYFVQEELETSHWPCDKCLEALKSIKMFWKIIIDKVFNLNLSKFEEFTPKCEPTDSVRSVAKVWETEIAQEALFIKNISPLRNNLRNRNLNLRINEEPKQETKTTKNDDFVKISRSKSYVIEPTDSNANYKRICKTVSKGISVQINTVDVGCDPCHRNIENGEIKALKKQIELLHDRSYHQTEEMEMMRKENLSLKIELENVYKSCPWKASFLNNHDKHNVDVQHTLTLVPKPFEANLEDNYSTKNIDSEMIITMKNCKNQSFKHVSLLQVLHKTNDPVVEDIPGTQSKHEDPMEILTKVQNTFGAIVKREMSIVNEKKHRSKKADMDSSLVHRIRASRSVPSCSTVSSRLSGSEQEFVSSKET